MAGKISDADKNLKVGNKLNSSMVKISSSKSILSYQNGSALNVENRECTLDEGMMPAEGFSEETSMSEEHFTEGQNLKSECLDILRKKLISDWSLSVFSTDLENKLSKMEPIEISKERQSVIQKLVVQISQLSDAEKLLLYLKLPSSTSSPFDPLRQPLNPLGNRQEIQQTIVWIKTHLEEDSEISIPKQDVYDQYLKYCENVSMKPLSTADFGKVMKQVYPGVRPRRLGTRGNSRYCYSGMRNTCKLPTPVLPQSSMESSILNGSSSDGSSSVSSDPNKPKKLEKTKRKLKSMACRSDKCTTSSQSSCSGLDKETACQLKSSKRSKMEEKEEGDGGELEKDQDKGEELAGVKCEETAENSYSCFNIDCGLASDFGIYFKNLDKIEEDSSRSGGGGGGGVVGDSPSRIKPEEKQNDFQTAGFHGDESQKKPIVEQSIGPTETRTESNSFSSLNGEQASKPNFSNGLAVEKANKNSFPVVSDQQKPTKSKTRKPTSVTKSSKSFKKSYVPIQPKPVEAPLLNVRFEPPLSTGGGGVGQFSSDRKKDSNGMNLCEESDSQEPEEEIVRYFKHLDESDLNSDGLVDQAVKNIENSSVQISGVSQIVSNNSKTPVAAYGSSEEVLNQATQQILRSQSCFEVQKGIFNLGENKDGIYTPRSQSSVELSSSSNDVAQQDVTDSESTGSDGKKKKISHLRILLQKSISSGPKNPYTALKNASNMASNGNPVMFNAQNQINNSVNQTVPNGLNFLLSKSVERDFLKLNGLKILGKSPSSFVPQSPNTRTKYFSFTPISPGPQSPLKTPSTPSASPFVSPRNTPVPRSRQNSYNDHFVSPSERKSAPIRVENGKSELLNENVFNFSKTLVGNARADGSKPPTYLQSCRPRSFSSTNFCRSKARRNSSKLSVYERPVNAKNQGQTVAENNFSVNAPFSINQGGQGFVSTESLSNEVQKFLESNSKLAEGQAAAATIRSQSVPLNRMISESTWMTTQISPVYSDYFSSGNSDPSLTPVSGKFSELVSSSETNSPKDVATNMSPFVGNGEINGLGTGSLSNGVFSGDPSMVHLNDQYFPGDFPAGNEDEPFGEDSTFSNKLDLNSGGTFDGPFTSDSDSAIAENIKSYFPDFEGLDNKSLAESSSGNADGVVGTERKLFKNVLYEGGGNDNLKDPVITSFKPVLMNELSSSPGSPGLNFFGGGKINEDNPQLIEYFDF